MTNTHFQDSSQRIWDVKLNLGKTMLVDRSDFKQYTDETIVLSKYDKDTIFQILTDTPLLFAVIGVIVRDQSKRVLEIDPDQDEQKFQETFASAIDGSVIDPARKAFVEALGDFFPAAKTVLLSSLQKVKEYENKVSERLQTEIMPLMDLKADQTINEAIEELKKKLVVTS